MSETSLRLLTEAPTLAVLGWFMFVVYPQQERMFRSMEKRSRLVILLMIAIPQISQALKDQMAEILKEIDEDERK
jgi:uncharacterized protein Yka (UPF0111/DUF47 family)